MRYIASIAFTLIGLLSPLPATSAPAAPPTEIAPILGELDPRDPITAVVRGIYDNFGGGAIWSKESRRRQLLKLLASLESEGIDVHMLAGLPGDEGLPSAQADVSATSTLARVAALLDGNAIDVQALPGWEIETPSQPLASVLIEAIGRDDIAKLSRALEPGSPEYRRLRAAYVRYRRLALAERWHQVSLPQGEKLLPQDGPEFEEIQRRLALLGDLPAGAMQNEWTGSVSRFQARHGLVVDGRVGPQTLAALNITPAQRAEQLGANMFYWRLLPRDWPERYVAVNAASATLEIIEAGTATYASRVIVGDPDHPTPAMQARIDAVTFNPPWTIPRPIAVKEILPLLKRRRDYLERNNMVILDRAPDRFGRDIDWTQYDQDNFPFQLRQLPGPGNALGLVKFEMANVHSVYLHDTPNRNLFNRNERTLSHGCVRVDCAAELAEKLIAPATWLESNVAGALKSGETLTVPIAKALPVYLLYFTAFVTADGTVNFRRDVYGRDAAVLAQLKSPLFRRTRDGS